MSKQVRIVASTHGSFTRLRGPSLVLWVILLAAVFPAGIVNAAGQGADEPVGFALGHVDFNVSCSAGVAEDFNRAVALLHHMQYVGARAAFEAIVETDPDCAMAHWGVAATLFQPLWPSRPGPAELQRGWHAVEAARRIGGLTDREADLLTAVEAFFRQPESAEWWTRIRRWSRVLDEAYDKRPEDIETAAFYALSQLAAGQVESDRMAYHDRAAKALLDIYARQPKHPGAVHYTIHANDIDGRAGKSLELVRSYDDIAPEVPHALHMPTHIFVRLGGWPEVITWNSRSAAAALKNPAGEAISHHYLHALDYLVYAHLQRGENEHARAIVERVASEQAPFQGSFISAFHLAAIPARYAVERRAWDEARAIAPREPSYLPWDRFRWAESTAWFARGLGAVHTGDGDEAERAERRMVALRDAARGAGEDAFANYIEVDRKVLAAWRAQTAGQKQEALELANSATELEGRLQKHPLTPGALYPSQEALGDLLLAQGRPHEAIAAFERSLERWPGRFNSISGAAKATRAAGLNAKPRELLSGPSRPTKYRSQ